MGTGQSVSKAIENYRQNHIDDTEPIHSERRSVREENQALYANITARSRDLLDIDASDDIIIHSYRGFAVITPANNEVDIDE